MNRAAAVDDLKRVFGILAEDADIALSRAEERDDQFARRTVFRTYFAFVEGLAFQLRQVTLASLQETDLLNAAETSILREERFQLNAKGLIEPRENFQSFLPSLLFSLRCYVKNHGATFEPDIGHAGWEAMRKASAIRDRLTHPKSVNGLNVSDEDTKILRAASAWWRFTLRAMFDVCEEADDRIREELKGGHDA